MPYHIDDEGDLQRMPGTHRFTHTPERTDPTIHTPDHPFCYDPTCTCHTNEEKLEHVQEWIEQGLMTEDEAAAYIAGRTC